MVKVLALGAIRIDGLALLLGDLLAMRFRRRAYIWLAQPRLQHGQLPRRKVRELLDRICNVRTLTSSAAPALTFSSISSGS